MLHINLTVIILLQIKVPSTLDIKQKRHNAHFKQLEVFLDGITHFGATCTRTSVVTYASNLESHQDRKNEPQSTSEAQHGDGRGTPLGPSPVTHL